MFRGWFLSAPCAMGGIGWLPGCLWRGVQYCTQCFKGIVVIDKIRQLIV